MAYEQAEDDERRRLAEAVRSACIRAALDGYEQAGVDGLCHEGAWEVAVDAIRRLDLAAILQAAGRPGTSA
jgi:hypothetical protein